MIIITVMSLAVVTNRAVDGDNKHVAISGNMCALKTTITECIEFVIIAVALPCCDAPRRSLAAPLWRHPRVRVQGSGEGGRGKGL